MSLGSSRRRSVCLWRCRMLSVPLGEQASGRRWDCSGLDHVVRRCFGTKWYSDVPGARSTRDGDTSNEDDSSFAVFLKLDKFKIIITLRRVQKFGDTGQFGDTGPYKNFEFLFNRLVRAIFLAKWFFTMFPCGNSRKITVKQDILSCP